MFEITALVEERDKKFEDFTSIKRIASKYYRNIGRDTNIFPIMPTDDSQDDESINKTESYSELE